MNKQVVLTTKQLTLLILALLVIVAVVAYVSTKHAMKKQDDESNGFMGDVFDSLNHIFNNTETTKLAVGSMIREQTQDIEHEEVKDRVVVKGFQQQDNS